ncbi:type II toxin-antitoxin system RelB/DinJ family antitoxin [Rhizorhabdus dicambivorans]|uniref:Type II toxin-antitoxin system antitoxin, RelB/DinJ family n=1 Tax=Rhizorhabdus dicambivorans TaxID=1850238 RepID=A0A2A4FW23_9SPHN|nr:type II toxin-antitoxin system RelB/DinJ family antitoxin [Rhizorhabdus dicambivorans]ATE65551.1 type II toxin-antitoxin system antitoxin, RelB/DinJ family [Rhizorhabdus dicambivorans]PCE41894.1 type II toxin-antitoxin system antitoxin, RelB/DinJ family [Rhizorhabdus dicambivorans]
MGAQTSMLHVRVDETLKAQASETLANVGLTVSDAVRILLTRIVKEGGLPAGLVADPVAHDAWFRAKVREALDDTNPPVEHDRVMADTRALIERKRRGQIKA